MGERSGLDLVASYDEAHENRGLGCRWVSTVSGAFSQDPDRYNHGSTCPLYVWRLSCRGPS